MRASSLRVLILLAAWLMAKGGGDVQGSLRVHVQTPSEVTEGERLRMLLHAPFMRLRGGQGVMDPQGASRGSVFLAKNPSPDSIAHTKNGLSFNPEDWSRSPPDMSPGTRSPACTVDDCADLFSSVSDACNSDGAGFEKVPTSTKGPVVLRRGQMLNEKNRVVGILGCGAFGTVYATVHKDIDTCLAVKVQRGGSKYTQVTLDEMDLLRAVGRVREELRRNGDVSGGDCVVELMETFYIHTPRKQLCMAFEMLGPSLLDLVIDYRYKGIPVPMVKSITRHALRGLMFLHKHCDIIHTDVKPENILLTLPKGGQFPHSREGVADWWAKNAVYKKSGAPWELRPGWSNSLAGAGEVGAKLVDLGNSCFSSSHFSENIQTIEYRSPEVVIGAGYTSAADIWSMACTVFEMLTGEYLFDPKESKDAAGNICYDRDEDLLAHHQELLGLFPREFALSGRHSSQIFFPDGTMQHITGMRFWGLADVLMSKYGWGRKETAELVDFLLPMLQPDPSKRATAENRLRHPWLAGLEELPDAD